MLALPTARSSASRSPARLPARRTEVDAFHFRGRSQRPARAVVTQHDKIFEQRAHAVRTRIKMNRTIRRSTCGCSTTSLHQLFKFSYDGKLVQTGAKPACRRGRQAFRPADRHRLSAGRHVLRHDGTPTRASSSSRRRGKYLTSWGTSSTGVDQSRTEPDAHGATAWRWDRSQSLCLGSHEQPHQIFDENGKYLDMWTNIRRPYHIMMSRDQSCGCRRRNPQDAEYDLALNSSTAGVRSVRCRAASTACISSRWIREQPLRI